MKNIHKLLIATGAALATFLAIAVPVFATSTFIVKQGGTGTTTPSGILYGDNGATTHVNTVTIGSNLTFSGGTLSATGGGGSGSVATSTVEAVGQVTVFSSNAATPATIRGYSTFNFDGTVLGIGTTKPTEVNANAKLTVAGISSQDIIASTTDNTTLSDAILQAYAPGSRIFVGAHGTNQVSSRYGLTLGGWGEITALNSSFGTTNGLILGTQPNVPIVFGTNNTEWARLLGTGNFGIGTTSPYTKLSVVGQVAAANFTATTTGQNTLPTLTSTNATTTGTLNIPNAATPTIKVAGDIAINTTAASSSVRYSDGSATRSLFPDGQGGLPYASSTLAYLGAYGAAGTTTLKQMRSYRPMSLLGLYCDTDTGTAYVTLGNGTASTTMQCSTASAFTASTVTFTMGQWLYVGIGTIASAPNTITVSPVIRKDSD